MKRYVASIVKKFFFKLTAVALVFLFALQPLMSLSVSAVTVSPPVISSFTASPTTITQGQSATLSWTLSGGMPTTLSIDNSIGDVLGKTSIVVKPAITTTYVLTATNTAGTVIQPIAIIVADNSPTTISNDFQYDQNGNVTSDGVNTYAYDYNNRLVSATTPTSTITYAYDVGGQRIKLATATLTTIYPTRFYNTDGTNKIKHIFAGSQDIATIQGSGAAAVIYYNATDSLNSSSVMTDSTGVIAETMDYFPFGGVRLDNKPANSAFNEQRKFIGQEFDADTGLNYLNARYYNSAIGRFISEDSVALSLGDEQAIKQITGKDQQQLLADPQALNSYSYANNNPIRFSDPTGKFGEDFAMQMEQTGFAPFVIIGGSVIAANAIVATGYTAYQNRDSIIQFAHSAQKSFEIGVNKINNYFSENGGSSNGNGPKWDFRKTAIQIASGLGIAKIISVVGSGRGSDSLEDEYNNQLNTLNTTNQQGLNYSMVVGKPQTGLSYISPSTQLSGNMLQSNSGLQMNQYSIQSGNSNILQSIRSSLNKISSMIFQIIKSSKKQ